MRRSSLQLLRLTVLTALAGCPPGEKPYVSPCVDGEPIPLADGSPSGFERCADGAIHRPSTATGLAYDPTDPMPACAGDEEVRACDTDAQCIDGVHGTCVSGTDYSDGYGRTSCDCVYACESDADCGTEEACVPYELTEYAYARCVPAACTTDADCETGECGLSGFDDGCGPNWELACRRETDACHGDGACESDQTCWPGYDHGSWECGDDFSYCAIGRPLLVEGTARVADPAPRADWADPSNVSLPLDPAVRAALTERWARVAALEHASVASFARVTLQLLALGAPPDLVADTQVAAADEVRHARLAYGLASRYGSAPVGPGPLALGDALPALDARSVMHALVSEACIGETLGAAELLAAADVCVDPSLAAALRAVGEEETRHAALAWRTLQWVLAGAPELRAEAYAALRARAAELVEAVPEGPDLPEHGVLGGVSARAVRRACLTAVLGPCIDACVDTRAA